MSFRGKKVQKSTGDELELGGLHSAESAPTSSSSKWLLKLFGTGRNKGESEKKLPEEKVETGTLQSYRHVPPDPPTPVFVEMEYGRKLSKGFLKRSKSCGEKATVYKANTETNGKEGGIDPQPGFSNNDSVKHKHTTTLTFPETVSRIAVATAIMGNVRRTSAIGDEIAAELTRKSQLKAKAKQQPVQIVSQTKMHFNHEKCDKETQTSTPDAPETNDEIHSLRICNTCNGMGVLAAAEKLEKDTQTEEYKGKGERKFPDPGSPPKRRHSTGNQDHNSTMITSMIQRADSNQFEPPTQSTAVKCVQYFLAFLYYVGMSPIKPVSARELPKWFQVLQLAFFTLFSAVSIIQALADVKLAWIGFCDKGDFMSFVTFGFFIGNWLARIYNIHTLVTSAAETAILLDKIDTVNTTGKLNKKGGHARIIAIGLGTMSMLLIGFDTIFGDVPFKEWTPQDVILDQSVELSQSFLIWTATNFTDVVQKLIKDYGTQLTPSTWMLGILGNMVTYCGVLHGCMMLDIWPIIALQILILQSHFSVRMEETKKLTKEERKGRCPLSIHWDYYMALRAVCDQSHCVFGKFLKVIHLQNILQFGYFLIQLLKTTGIHATVLVNTFSVIKVGLTYYFVQRSADKNEEYEDCVIQCAERRPTIEMGGIEVSVIVLIKDMKKHPIGVGRGDFFVNEGFVLKIACFVGSLFALLADDLEKERAKS